MDHSGQQRSAQVPGISVREAWQRLTQADGTSQAVLIDVREVWEFSDGHAQGAINVPLSQFRERYTEVPRDRDVLMICHVGGRSLQAARFLQTKGVTRVANVEGGTDDWEAQGLPMQRGDG